MGVNSLWRVPSIKTTGNLAVLNADDVAVYPDASGSPTLYSGGGVYGDYALGYGGRGDLLVDGGSYDNRNFIAFAQLPLGARHLKEAVLSKIFQWAPPTFVQWDGQFWVVGTSTLDWFKIAGTKGRFEGYTMLSPTSPIARFWIARSGAGANAEIRSWLPRTIRTRLSSSTIPLEGRLSPA